jgi:PhnB protein
MHMPKGRSTITPRIITPDVEGVVGFMKAVFGARGELQTAAPVDLAIGDSIVMVSDGGGARDPMPAFLYVYVEKVDDVFKRAVDAGAETLESPEDMPWGDRRATVRDPWKNIWQIATHLGP